MTDYTKTTNFTVKDTLVSGNPAKIIRGSEFDTEFNNIQVSVATKANIASPSFTGDVTAADGNFVGNLIGNVTGNVVGNVTGDLTGNSTGTHTGNVVGNVTGELTGNVTGNVVGNVTGTASNAAQLDNLDSTQFLRSDVSDTFTNLTGSSLTSNIITDNVDGTGNLVFERSGSEKMRLTSDGKLLVGTTVPSQQSGVTIHGSFSHGLIDFTKQGDSAERPNIRFFDSSNGLVGSIDNNDASLSLKTIGQFPLIFDTSNTERMRLTSDGALLVGKTTKKEPTSVFEVLGATDTIYMNVGADDINGDRGLTFESFSTTSQGDGHLINASSVTGILAFGAANQERMRLTSDGNLAIGTTASDRSRLNVKTDALGTVIGDETSLLTLRTTTFNENFLDFKAVRTGLNVQGNSTTDWRSASLRIQQAVDATPMAYMEFGGHDNNAGISFGAGNGNNLAERMRLTSDGKLGIGVIDPNFTLDVAGNLLLKGKNETSEKNIIRFEDTDTQVSPDQTIGGIEFFGNDVSVPSNGVQASIKAHHLGTLGGAYLSLSTSALGSANNTERMRLTSDGYLKVDPNGTYLDQVGNSALAGPFHQFNSSGSDNIVAYAGTNNTVGVFSLAPDNYITDHFRARTHLTDVFKVRANGDVIGGAGSSFSDIKLKENITDATSKLEDINKVRFVNYCFKEGPRAGNKEFGVIAQELEEIFPNLIINTPDTEEVEVTTTDEEGNEVVTTETRETGEVTKSVKYSVLTLMAVKALQEADAKIEAQKTLLESQQSIIDSLLERVEALEAK